MKKLPLHKYLSSVFLVLSLSLSTMPDLRGDDSSKNLEFIFIGKDDAPVEIKVFSSLTCPHCANFHTKVISKIKKKYVNTGKVKIIFIDFPLDLAALSASKLLHCAEKNKQMLIMDLIYEKQEEWIVGNTIDEINDNLKKIATTSGINSDKIKKCFSDEAIENMVLNGRIEGHKKYSISSTPTIIINEKKYKGSNDFESLEKLIKKNI